jgi:hypothetical protein
MTSELPAEAVPGASSRGHDDQAEVWGTAMLGDKGGKARDSELGKTAGSPLPQIVSV